MVPALATDAFSCIVVTVIASHPGKTWAFLAAVLACEGQELTTLADRRLAERLVGQLEAVIALSAGIPLISLSAGLAPSRAGSTLLIPTMTPTIQVKSLSTARLALLASIS